MANAKFDPVAQYPDYQPGAGSMLMKSLLAIQAHKDEQARQALLDKAHIAEQQSIQQQREQQMQDDAFKQQLALQAILQKQESDRAVAEAAGKVGAEQAKGNAATQVANTQAAADMHGATTQALADMHGAGTQANADTNAANIEAASAANAAPEGESAPTPQPPPEPTPPPPPPALPHPLSFFNKTTGQQINLPIYSAAQQDAIEKDALAKKVAETEAMARAKEPSTWIITNPNGSSRMATKAEIANPNSGAQEIPIHPGLAELFRGGNSVAKLTAPAHTNIGGREMLWNPATNKFDIDSGPAGSPKDTSMAEANLLQRSYDKSQSSLDKLAKPYQDQMERLNRLNLTISQKTAASDPLIAPELLTVMAGGQGSGLRMNEAEIARIVGGRNNWEAIKAAANKWKVSNNPNAGLTVTDLQRQQIYKLLESVHGRVQKKLDAIAPAYDQLVTAPDVTSHHKIVNAARSAMDRVDTAPEQSTDSSVVKWGRDASGKPIPLQ